MNSLVRTKYQCEMSGLMATNSFFSEVKLWCESIKNDKPINMTDELIELIRSKNDWNLFIKNKGFYCKV